MEKSIGFIGLGSMGLPMAHNLLKAGFRIHVYNRNKERASTLVTEGAKIAKHPCDVLEDSEIVISMVSNDAALEEIVNGPNGLSSRLQKGVVHLSMSTVSPATAKKLKEEHAAKGAAFLSATVSGRPDVAAAGNLWIFLAGEKIAKDRVKAILEVLGQRTFDLGDEAEQANIYKLVNNFLIISAIQALGEAFAFAEKNGLSPKQAADVITESQFACPIYKIYAPLLAQQKFEPAGFALELGFKDIRILNEVADQTLVPMPLGNLVYEQLMTCMARGFQKKDWSVIAKLPREDANLDKK